MDFLRRSIHGKDVHLGHPHISTPIPAVSKPTTAIQPPKKVIRALDDHRPQAPHELSFTKGDFFHVINEVDQGPGWYEANNPMTGARGLVPKSKFEVFNKSNAAVRVSQVASPLQPKSPSIKSPTSSLPTYHAIVQHNFEAERPDELDARAGDHISVVAQSNLEWFVAKPISRLGRPGLIPVSFVAIHDPKSGEQLTEEEIREMMRRKEIPGVDEWKRSIIEYKATSISLGVLDDTNPQNSITHNSYTPHSYQEISKMEVVPEDEPEPIRASTPVASLPPGIILSSEILSWHFEMNDYWFRIHALFQPDGDPDTGLLPPAKQLILFRAYNDFYDFQVALLGMFPTEAGRTSNNENDRILPFMPGPSETVDDKITQMRKEELDTYLNQFCSLWRCGADYILRSKLVLQFFAAKSGDIEEDVEPAKRLFEERAAARQNPQYNFNPQQINGSISKMGIQEASNRNSDGSYYDDRAYTGSLENVNGVCNTAGEQRNHPDDDPEVVYPRSHSPYTSTSRTQSPIHHRNESSVSTMSRFTPRDENGQITQINGTRRSEDDSPRSYTSNHNTPLSAAPSTSSSKTRARSGSNALTSPPISANNPNTAFVKIKIFDRTTQELIAIRVNPRVSCKQLMEKVRARLGDDVRHLAYRDSISNAFVGLDDDQSLQEWIEGTDKHQLFC